jgi:hypothetical protein
VGIALSIASVENLVFPVLIDHQPQLEAVVVVLLQTMATSQVSTEGPIAIATTATIENLRRTATTEAILTVMDEDGPTMNFEIVPTIGLMTTIAISTVIEVVVDGIGQYPLAVVAPDDAEHTRKDDPIVVTKNPIGRADASELGVAREAATATVVGAVIAAAEKKASADVAEAGAGHSVPAQ